MINAAIVGLGWWGRTLVESVQGTATRSASSPARRGRCRRRCTAFAEAQGLRLRRQLRGAARRPDGRCGGAGDAALAACGAGDRRGAGGQARLLREAVRADQGRCRRGGRRDDARPASRSASATTGASIPEMTKLREQIRSRRARHDPARRSDDDVPECAAAEGRRLARAARRDAVRRADADGRARHRRDDRSVRRRSTRSTARASAASSRSTADDTTSMLFRMKDGMSGLSRHDDGDRARASASRCSARRAGCGSKGMTHVAGASSEERRTRLFGTCKFQPIKGPAEVWEAATLDVTRASLEAFAAAAPAAARRIRFRRRDDPRRRRHRGGGALGGLGQVERST